MVEKALSEEQRKQVFLDLVVAQDHDMSVLQSRQHIAARYDAPKAESRDAYRVRAWVIRELGARTGWQNWVYSGWPRRTIPRASTTHRPNRSLQASRYEPHLVLDALPGIYTEKEYLHQ